MFRNIADVDPKMLIAIKILDSIMRDARALALPYCCNATERASLRHEQHKCWCRSRVFQPGVTTPDEELEQELQDLESLVEHTDFAVWVMEAGSLPVDIEPRRQVLRDVLQEARRAQA